MSALSIGFVLGAFWSLPAVVLIGLYGYEVCRRRVAPTGRGRRPVRMKPTHCALLERAPHSYTPEPALVTAEAAFMDPQPSPCRVEVPVLLADAQGHTALHRCTLCLN